jgi:hypothetical protein
VFETLRRQATTMKPDDGLLAEGGATLAFIVDVGIVIFGDR